jgi:uncharacterized protein
MVMKLIVLTLSWLLLFCVSAFADDTATFNAMMALAQKGDAEAQYHVGMMYNNGIGTAQNTKEAFGWFEKSAASDHPLGAYKLGCYFAGQGAGVVAADAEKALKYKLVAAQAGYSLAQLDVAATYSRQGDSNETVRWLSEVAMQGDDRALFGLSSLYLEGDGVPKDMSRAFAFYKLSLLASRSAERVEDKAVLDDMMAKMSETNWSPQPTVLTIKAMEGIAAAEAYVKEHQN